MPNPVNRRWSDYLTFTEPTPDTAYAPVCPECGRVFNLCDPTDAAEWSAGHDCEAGDNMVRCTFCGEDLRRADHVSGCPDRHAKFCSDCENVHWPLCDPSMR